MTKSSSPLAVETPWSADAPQTGATDRPASPPPDDALVIEPAGAWPRIDLRELWAYRQLFYFLVWRDLKVRYAQTVLGLGWAVAQPLLATLIFTLIFGRFARVPSDGVPYAAFALAGLVPWNYFSAALSGSSQSLVSSSNLITKVYFPRLVIPFAPVLAAMVDFAVGVVLVLAVVMWYGLVPAPEAIVMVPLLTILLATIAAGVGCWLSALNIQYRDVKHVTPFLIQIWMFASPIVYPMSIVPESLRPYYVLNPLVGVIEGFRAVLLRTGTVPWTALAVSFAGAAILLVTGAFYFRRTERVFADVA